MSKNDEKKGSKKTPQKGIANNGYTAADITVLEGLEPVRKRPGMYIGTTGPDGLHHLIVEVFDNARDEAMGGFANDIEVVLLPGNRVRVADNGRGIPVDVHKQTKVSALETIMTTLHAGGKFGGQGYKVSGGLHGVGVSVVNALSVWTRADVYRDGGHFVQEYERGKPQAKVKRLKSSDMHGTVVTFEPDPEIFEKIEFSFQRVVSHMRQQAYLAKGTRISVIDARLVTSLPAREMTERLYVRGIVPDIPSMTFYFEGGLISFIEHYNSALETIHKHIFYAEKTSEGVAVEIALQYVDDISARVLAFANNTYNSEGGMHVTGFKTALTRTLNAYARKNNYLKESEENFTGDDALEGLTAVISVKLHEVQFEGQTKAKLGSVEARSAVDTVFGEALASFLEENPDDARAIINKVIVALKARKAAKAAKDSVLRKSALEGLALPGKLADCQAKDPADSELFIVEGDSAGGSSKQGRDRKTQAVLPLKGKVLNVERARLDKVLAFQEIKNLIIALGTGIGDLFDVSKLRYHKVIIATDADTDGGHIRTLLLTLFYRYFRPVIDGGFLYIAQPPLYKIARGKEVHYFYSEDEKEAFLKKEGLDTNPQIDTNDTNEEEGGVLLEANEANEAKKHPKVSIQRYKGLGEMNAEELWETTMDPARRILKRVAIEDAQEADRVFDTLMGTDVFARKSFIQSNAKLANLDI